MNDARFCRLLGTNVEVIENVGSCPVWVATESRYGGCLRASASGSCGTCHWSEPS